MRKIEPNQILDILNINKTMSYSDIAKMLNCSKPLIQYWFRKLGIKRDRISQQKINNTNRNKPIIISDEAKEILVGTLLGDSTVRKYNRNCESARILNSCICCGHSYLQKEYALYLKKCLENAGLKISYTENSKITYSYIKDHIAKVNGICNVSTQKNISFNSWRDDWYPDGKKIVPRSIENIISAKSLAFWFMDDGTLSNTKKEKHYTICTQGFTCEDVDYLREILLKKFNIHTTRQKSICGPIIYIRSFSKKLFTELIRPYVCETMKYKLIDYWA